MVACTAAAPPHGTEVGAPTASTPAEGMRNDTGRRGCRSGGGDSGVNGFGWRNRLEERAIGLNSVQWRQGQIRFQDHLAPVGKFEVQSRPVTGARTVHFAAYLNDLKYLSDFNELPQFAGHPSFGSRRDRNEACG